MANNGRPVNPTLSKRLLNTYKKKKIGLFPSNHLTHGTLVMGIKHG